MESLASNSDGPGANLKIHNDLQIVVDKMNACDTLLKTAPSQELLAVVGFLEACQPRMIELVEAAAQGALSEQVLMECLQVNDRLTKILSDVDCLDLTGAAERSVNDGDLFLTESVEDAESPLASLETKTAGLKTTGEDEGVVKTLDDLLDLSISNGDNAEAETVTKTKSDDEFDDFFSSRQIG
jgi:hypothetical protein